MLNFKKSAVCAALLGVFPLSVPAAVVKLGQAGPGGLTAVILPDAAEVGNKVNVYMAAILGGQLFLRDGLSTGNWVQYNGGPLPVAVPGLTLADSMSVSVVDFDLSGLPGLEVYVAYGVNEADIFDKPGHLAKVHTVGAPASAPNAACDPAAAPEGISYTQDGNKITVTTNGQCVPVPKAALCNAPAPAQATGLSVLSTLNVANMQMSGISVNLPGLPNPFEEVGQLLANSNAQTCLRNAPADYSSYSMDVDVCYDITDQIDQASLQAAGPLVTVAPPITERFQGTIDNAAVADCFATGAITVIDALTKEIWIKQADGSYQQPSPQP